MAKYTAIGGQALIEGILMRSPEKTALAVRKPDKTIDISYMEGGKKKHPAFFKWPFIRGIFSFVESLKTGYTAMMRSAEISGYTDLEEDAPSAESDTETAAESADASKSKINALVNAAMVLGVVLGVVLAGVLFVWLPRSVVSLIGWLLRLNNPQAAIPSALGAVIEQIIKLAVFVVYVWAVSFMKDIRRVFMYHGAEHKTIFCYEAGLPLTVENVRRQRRFHPRCGTSFIILMILVSLLFSLAVQGIFSLFGIKIYTIFHGVLWVAVKLLLIPLICGAGYEVLRICGKYDNTFTKIISAPGLWLQRLTTKEPADEMIEIAIAALRACEPAVPDVDRAVDALPPADGESV